MTDVTDASTLGALARQQLANMAWSDDPGANLIVAELALVRYELHRIADALERKAHP